MPKPMASRRHNRRLGQQGKRKLKPTFVLSTEGAKTEPSYFTKISEMCGKRIAVRYTRGRGSDPGNVLQSMKRHLDEKPLDSRDQAWLVVDRDEWPPREFNQLAAWASGSPKHGLAVSNPCFELWLLLHFTGRPSGQTCKAVTANLRKHIPSYDKDAKQVKISLEMVMLAIERARASHGKDAAEWPQNRGSTVFAVVEEMLNAAGKRYPAAALL